MLTTPLLAQRYFGLPEHVACSHSACGGLVGTGELNDSFIPPPASYEPNGERSVIISTTYTGFSPEATAAYDYAVDIWSSLLTSNVPILIEAQFGTTPEGVLGFAGASNAFADFSGAPQPGVIYPAPLADKLHGGNLEPGAPDIVATFSDEINWYFGTDGNPGPDQYDFVSVVLHELGHGFGFAGSAQVSGSNGTFLNSLPLAYDTFVEDGSGNVLFDFAPGLALYMALTSDDLFWTGTEAIAANSGAAPKLYAPGTWQPGSSYAHWDENTYPTASGNALMTPLIGLAEAIHDPGALTIGLMHDIGWFTDDSPCADVSFELQLNLDCYGEEVTWEVRDFDGEVLVSGGPYSNLPVADLQPITEFICLPEGCYRLFVFDAAGNGINSASDADCPFDGSITVTDPNGMVLGTLSDFGSSDFFEFCSDGLVAGCTDPVACNYEPEATTNNNSCIEPGCSDTASYNYNPFADCFNNDVCVYFDVDDIQLEIDVHEVVNSVVGAADLTGYITYRVYLNVGTENRLASMYSVYESNGDPNLADEMQLFVDMPCGCYQDPLGGILGTNSNCNLFPFFPEHAYDTYFTIGLPTSCDQGESMLEIQLTTPPAENINPNECLPPIVNGSIFTNLISDNGLPDEDGRVLVGQVTTCGEFTFSGCFTVPIEDTFVLASVCREATYVPVFACMDPAATNYNPEALIDDGSCIYGVEGCTDPVACNYDPAATVDDGSCLLPPCTACVGDFNNDGIRNTDDLLIFLSNYNCNTDCAVGDLDENGAVNTSDLLVFLGLFGLPCNE